MISEKAVSQGSRFFAVHSWHLQSQHDTHKNCAQKSPLKLPSCELVLFINMNTYIQLQKAQIQKTFVKENYPIGVDCFYICTKRR